ncbi:MAG: hypothetical protein SX243_20260 [Acidobacteriota bacterium]|nr:hypothetical protein [Acidobacteriota bacterium]
MQELFSRRSRSLAGLALAVALILTVLPAAGQQHAEPVPAQAQAAQADVNEPTYTEVTTLNGLRVYVDENGRLRPPTESEAAEISRNVIAGLGEATRHQVPKKNGSGMMSLVLDTSYLSTSMAHVTPDGSLHWNCGAHGDVSQDVASQAPVSINAAAEEK